MNRRAVLLRQLVFDVAHLVQPAPLLLGARENGCEGLPNALCAVGDKHRDVLKATLAEALEDHAPALGALTEGVF